MIGYGVPVMKIILRSETIFQPRLIGAEAASGSANR